MSVPSSPCAFSCHHAMHCNTRKKEHVRLSRNKKTQIPKAKCSIGSSPPQKDPLRNSNLLLHSSALRGRLPNAAAQNGHANQNRPDQGRKQVQRSATKQPNSDGLQPTKLLAMASYRHFSRMSVPARLTGTANVLPICRDLFSPLG